MCARRLIVFLTLLSFLEGLSACAPAPLPAPSQAAAPQAPASSEESCPACPTSRGATPLLRGVNPPLRGVNEAGGKGQRESRLILATTTSTADSGLLDFLLPDFTRQYGARVDVLAVGTGEALKLGQDGNADVLLVHAAELEEAFMAAGHGVRREPVMANDFVIVGPAADPAHIRGLKHAATAFARIAAARAPFVSRGDGSGTYVKERAIWRAAGLEPDGDWYLSAGQGMGAVLTMADELQAYTLSDRATFLARRARGISLAILVEGDPSLLNHYSVIAVNPAKSPLIQAELANAFIDWLTSQPVQEQIGRFGVAEYGMPLFRPASAVRGSQAEPATD